MLSTFQTERDAQPDGPISLLVTLHLELYERTPMKHPTGLRQGLLVLSLALAALPAVAEDDCDAPLARWQSREAVRQMAAQQGWQIQRLKIDDGCYEVRGTDAQGRSFKAKLDPETLKVLKLKHGDTSHGRERERERGDPGAAATTPRGTAN
jgi:hypothetical protein